MTVDKQFIVEKTLTNRRQKDEIKSLPHNSGSTTVERVHYQITAGPLTRLYMQPFLTHGSDMQSGNYLASVKT